MADGINVGDAVLTFLGDTTQLDLAFDKVEQGTQGSLEPANQKLKEVAGNWQFTGQAASTAGDQAIVAGEEMEAGAELGARSLREAKGEAALLGEQFGVHLPRHVRTFIAELPGVGEALSAAFSATAILFVIQAIVELTKKVTDFVGEHFIFTEEMKASTAEIVKNNVELSKQSEAFEKAKESIENFGKTQQELADEKVAKLSKAITDQGAVLRQAQDNLYGYRNGLLELSEAKVRENQNQVTLSAQTLKALNEQLEQAQLEQQKVEEENLVKHRLSVINLYKTTTTAILNLQEQQLKTSVAGTQGAQDAIYQIEQTYADKRYQVQRAALERQLALEKQFGAKDNADKLAQLNAELDKLDAEHTQHYFAELQKQKEALDKTLKEMAADVKAAPPIEIVLPENVKKILDMRAAAQALGITLRSDLAAALDTARKAKEQFLASGGKDVAEIKQFDDKIKEAQKNLDHFGQSYDKLRLKSETTWKGLIQDLRQGVQVTHELGAAGEQAFNQMAAGLQSAIASAILGEKNFGKALEEATAQALAQLSAQALVKALFYTAEGFAALASLNYSGAAQYFEAAGVMAAVGGAAGIAGAALHGGSGGGNSSSNYQTQNSVSNTTSQAGGRTLAVAVQKFGSGGLVSSPVLGVVGEDTARSGPEVVAGLNDRETWQKIAKAIQPHVAGTGGAGINVHVKGLVSPDNLSKVIGQINRRVSRGQSHLQASSTFRITRRSA